LCNVIHFCLLSCCVVVKGWKEEAGGEDEEGSDERWVFGSCWETAPVLQNCQRVSRSN